MLDLPLPVMGEQILCTDYSLRHSLDPRGTALAGVIVLVELLEPWPKPVGRHKDMVDLVAEVKNHDERIRLLAAVSHNKRKRRIISFRSVPGGMIRTEVEQGDDPVGALRATLSARTGTEVLVGPDASRTLLVCTQGSHDVCCGTFGTELAEWAEANLGEVDVFRVSHTGGHRFAPTAMTLPDGRMWARLSGDRLSGVLDQSIPAAEAASFCRGWWGTPMGPAQIAELEVLAVVGWQLDAEPRSTIVRFPGSGVFRVTLTLDRSRWLVDLVPSREVPTITCESAGGLPAKPHQEWVLKGNPTEHKA